MGGRGTGQLPTLRSTRVDLYTPGTLFNSCILMALSCPHNQCSMNQERPSHCGAHASYRVMEVRGKKVCLQLKLRPTPSVAWTVPYAGMHHLAPSSYSRLTLLLRCSPGLLKARRELTFSTLTAFSFPLPVPICLSECVHVLQLLWNPNKT